MAAGRCLTLPPHGKLCVHSLALLQAEWLLEDMKLYKATELLLHACDVRNTEYADLRSSSFFKCYRADPSQVLNYV